MFPTDFNTWVIYVVLTVILGAIGSGFWEAIFKPFFTLITRVFLRISTFGLAAARDSIYKEIARRSLNKPILQLLFMITLFMSVVLGMASSKYMRSSISEGNTVKLVQDKERYLEILKNLPKEEVEKHASELKIKLHAIETELAKQIFLGVFLGVLFLFVISIYGYARNSYICLAISYFDQCLAICRPYITPEERVKFLAQYASVSSKSDFALLIKSISNISETQNLVLPKFIML